MAEIEGEIVADSPAILRRLEELPRSAAVAGGASHRVGVDIFIDWFNRVWKLAPNAIAAELETGTARRSPHSRALRARWPRRCGCSRRY